MRQRSARGQNDVWRQRDQFRSIFAIVFGIACGKPIIKAHIVAVGPAQLVQLLLKCREAYIVVLIVAATPESTPMRRIVGLLCARSQRPRCR